MRDGDEAAGPRQEQTMSEEAVGRGRGRGTKKTREPSFVVALGDRRRNGQGRDVGGLAGASSHCLTPR